MSARSTPPPDPERLVDENEEGRTRPVPEPDQVIEEGADEDVSDPGGDSDPNPGR